jgi:uncharacterized protein (DUF736 family)
MVSRDFKTESTMPAIGHVTKSEDGNFKGQLKTLSFRAPIDILLNPSKNGDTQPDYRVYSQAVEIGAGWIKKGKTSGEDYISLSLADPAFGPKKLYANLGRAAGQDDENVFAVIWTPAD